MKPGVRYRRRFNRFERLKELAVLYALHIRKPDFSHNRPLVSIIGDHISDVIRAEGIYERKYLHVLRDCILNRAACREKVAIDVGANIGNHSIFLSDLFAQVIAFEPNPLARSLLQLNLDLNRVRNTEVKPIGLSEQPGLAALTFDKSNLGAAHCTSAFQPEPDALVEVELAVGDEVIDPAVAIGFIKVDVEGAEGEVLRGLAKTIQRHRPVIMIEQLQGAIDPVSGTSPSFILLRELGYTALDIRPGRFLNRQLAAVASLILGHATYHICPVSVLEKRDYYALVFVPGPT